MKKLEKIKNRIESLQRDATKNQRELREEAMKLFEREMKAKSAIILSLISAVENSRELTQVEYDDYFHQWIRVDFSCLIDTDDDFQKGLLSDFLQNHYCLDVNYLADFLTYSIGPAIIINDDGDVLDQDSGKWIISRKEYENQDELNSLIEAWMEKTGYFPAVVSCDRYGNAFYVNTQKRGA